MSRYYQRPENALKKANEFIEVGKPTRALDTLYDVIKGKKHRTFSEKVIEPIMLKYLELCVELKKPHTAKEGLYQYRIMCQSVNIGLLEKVIRSFVKMAEERTEQARDALKDKVLLEHTDIAEVDDLDNLAMADMTLLNVITEEQAQERSDRAAIIPWIKFLWEAHTQCLDLLRNNAKLEGLYHDIAQMAFKFCLSYNRKTEFRKLCERLRKHFDDIVNRAMVQPNSIDFSSPETQQLNMETRLAQLDSAIAMELWQEAYKAIEDIHLLMNQSKRSQTRMMAYYYQKLSLVFSKAGNHLFHAATLLRYYNLCKDMKKNMSPLELQKNASQVVLATLAIPFSVAHPEFERFVETEKGMMEKAQKLATLLFLPSPPTRASMIRDLTRYNVLGTAIEELQSLHNILETEFNPLELCERVSKSLETLMDNPENEHLAQYVEYVQDVTLVRLIRQISQVYQSIDYGHFLSLTVFADQLRLEQLIVDMVRYSDMQITIDHRENCIRFGSAISKSGYDEQNMDEVQLQEMPSESVRMQLVNVFNSLEESLNLINPDGVSEAEERLRNKIYSNYLLTEKHNHVLVLQRQKIIADRREELERTQLDRENEEKWRSEQVMKQQMMLEQKRLETEREERERKKKEQEIADIQQKRIRDKIGQMSQTKLGRLVVSRLEEDDLGRLDIETVMQKQQEELQKEASERIIRMTSQYKRLDHMERAKRIEEIPVIDAHMGRKKEIEKREWDLHEQERIVHLIEERKNAVKNRDRMKRMKEDKESFLKNLLEARRGIFLKKLKEFEKTYANEKQKRLNERKKERQDQRRRKYLEERAEEERRRLEEIQREEEARHREEKLKAEKEIEERNRRTLELQQAKQKEIEERLEKEKSLIQAPVPTPRVSAPAEPYRPRFRERDSSAPVATRSAVGEAPEGRRGLGYREVESQLERTGERGKDFGVDRERNMFRKEELGEDSWRASKQDRDGFGPGMRIGGGFSRGDNRERRGDFGVGGDTGSNENWRGASARTVKKEG